MQLVVLTEELKQRLWRVLARFYINPPNKDAVVFEQIGAGRGFNSALHRMRLEDGRSYAIKLTDNEEADLAEHGAREILRLMHDRELEFYVWLDGVRSEPGFAGRQREFGGLLGFCGGDGCAEEVGVLILEDLSSRVAPRQPDYTAGYSLELVLQVVRRIAAFQAISLCAEREFTRGEQIKQYTLPVVKTLPKLAEAAWMTDRERDSLRAWTTSDAWFAIHTVIPEDFPDISPVLVHADLWAGNLLFELKRERKEGEEEFDFLAFVDWQTCKMGNPLTDIATMVGENMSTEARREHTETVLACYVEEVMRRKADFKRPFQMTMEKARQLLTPALRTACIQTWFAVSLCPSDDVIDEGESLGRLSLRLRELIQDVHEDEQRS